MKRYLHFFQVIMMTLGLTALLLPAQVAHAQTTSASPSREESLCVGSGGTWGKNDKNEDTCINGSDRTVMGTIQAVTNLLLFLIGAIAVIMLIIGGVRYTTSAGDQNALTGAKNTVLYSLVGLIVAFAGFAIVNFVIGALESKPAPPSSTETE